MAGQSIEMVSPEALALDKEMLQRLCIRYSENMDDSTTKIVARLKACKQQGMSYYQAVQRLKGQGFTDDQINLVADSYPYVEIASASGDNAGRVPPVALSSSRGDELAGAILKDQRSSVYTMRATGYVLSFVLGAYFSYRLMRLYGISPARHICSSSNSNIYEAAQHGVKAFNQAAQQCNAESALYIPYTAGAVILGGVAVCLCYALYMHFRKRSSR